MTADVHLGRDGRMRGGYGGNTQDPSGPMNRALRLARCAAQTLAATPTTGQELVESIAASDVSATLQDVKAEIGSLKPSLVTGSVWRAREVEEGLPPGRDFFKPKSPPHRAVGRFNASDQLAWYVARIPGILDIEMTQDGRNRDCWVRGFDLPSSGLEVVSLEPPEVAHLELVNVLAVDAGRPKCVADSGQKHPYGATILLRTLLEQRGVKALQYPSVHGAYGSNARAVNLTIMDCDLSKEILSAPHAETDRHQFRAATCRSEEK